MRLFLTLLLCLALSGCGFTSLFKYTTEVKRLDRDGNLVEAVQMHGKGDELVKVEWPDGTKATFDRKGRPSFMQQLGETAVQQMPKMEFNTK